MIFMAFGTFCGFVDRITLNLLNMKAMNNIGNLRKLTIAAYSVLFFTAASFGQPEPVTDIDEETKSAARLEQIMHTTEQTAMFVAPDVADQPFPESENLSENTANEVLLVENSQQRSHFMRSNPKFNPCLMRIGFYQKVKPTVWSRLKKIVNNRPASFQKGGYRILSATYIVDAGCTCHAL